MALSPHANRSSGPFPIDTHPDTEAVQLSAIVLQFCID
jgi:hypothetical protein